MLGWNRVRHKGVSWGQSLSPYAIPLDEPLQIPKPSGGPQIPGLMSLWEGTDHLAELRLSSGLDSVYEAIRPRMQFLAGLRDPLMAVMNPLSVHGETATTSLPLPQSQGFWELQPPGIAYLGPLSGPAGRVEGTARPKVS